MFEDAIEHTAKKPLFKSINWDDITETILDIKNTVI